MVTKEKVKYLSSPKEASGNAKAAFLGASAMFEGFKMGILGCCQVLPSMEPVFIRVSEFSFTPHDTCFIAVSTDSYYVFTHNVNEMFYANTGSFCTPPKSKSYILKISFWIARLSS